MRDLSVDGHLEIVAVVPPEPRRLVAQLRRPRSLVSLAVGISTHTQRRRAGRAVYEVRRDENPRLGDEEIWAGAVPRCDERSVGFIQHRAEEARHGRLELK